VTNDGTERANGKRRKYRTFAAMIGKDGQIRMGFVLGRQVRVNGTPVSAGRQAGGQAGVEGKEQSRTIPPAGIFCILFFVEWVRDGR